MWRMTARLSSVSAQEPLTTVVRDFLDLEDAWEDIPITDAMKAEANVHGAMDEVELMGWDEGAPDRRRLR